MSTIAKFLEVCVKLHSVLTDHMQLLVEVVKFSNDSFEALPISSILSFQLFTRLIMMLVTLT